MVKGEGKYYTSWTRGSQPLDMTATKTEKRKGTKVAAIKDQSNKREHRQNIQTMKLKEKQET